MDRCEHNDKFVKFCITENCQHKEAAGCEYCIKRYHFHLTSPVLLTEPDIENAVKALNLPSALRPEVSAIQDGFTAYLIAFKQAVGVWVDETIDVVCNRMAYPLLSHQGILDTYRKLKKKDYRKITAKDLRSVTNFAKTSVREDIERDQKRLYIEATAPLLQVTQAVQTTLKAFCAQVNSLLNSKAIKLSNSTLEYFIQESSYPKKIATMINRVQQNLNVKNDSPQRLASHGKQSQQRSPSIDQGKLKPLTTTRQRRPSIIVPQRMSATKGNLLDMMADQRPSGRTLKEDGDKSNILPPLPIEIPKANYEEAQKQPNKVITFAITPSEGLDGVKSPIQKEKQRKLEKPQQFQIKVNLVGPSKEPVLENIKEDRREDIVTPGIQPPKQTSTSTNFTYTTAQKQPEDQCVMLQHNQKDSLLLFSESLKCSISTEKAIPLLEGALRYAPNNLSAAEYLSFLYLEVGRAKDCLTVCQGILSLVEDKSEEIELSLHLQNNKATALNMLGRYSESIEILEKCIKHRNKDYFYKNLGDAYFCLGIFQKAVPNYERAIAKNQESDEANYNYAVCLYMQQNYEEALLMVKRALEIESRNEIYQELEKEILKKVKARC